jgi:hypothetical protein
MGMATKANVTISAPNIQTAEFRIEGTDPLVIHRVSQKLEGAFAEKIKQGSTPRGKARHEAADPLAICEAAKYIGQTADGERWEGFNAASIRCAMISACRLVNFKMTLAKLSLFVLADGRDVFNPLYHLVRIYGQSECTQIMGRTETGVAMLVIRPMYYPWEASLRIRYDADQFQLQDIANLLLRAGTQVGIGEGRPDSKNSAGMGWGLFTIKG